jgi:hypothetical protein
MARCDENVISTSAQPGIAVDRFAREIVRFLKVTAARSRQLMGNSLGG